MSVLPTETPPNPAPAPEPAKVEWPDYIPQESRTEELQGAVKYKTPVELAKGYVNLVKELGGRFKVPAADAPAEEWGKFYAKLPENMRPASKPEDLDIEVPAGVDKTALDEIKKLALAEKVSPTAYKKILSAFLGKQADSAKTQEDAKKAIIEGWKEANAKAYKGDLEKMTGLAQRAVQLLVQGGKVTATEAEILKATGLEHSPLMLEVLSEYGGRRANSAIPAGGTNSDINTVPQTIPEVDKKIEEFKSSESFRNRKDKDSIPPELGALYEAKAKLVTAAEAAP